MPPLRCATCGAEHDWTELEPTYGKPDAYLAVPPEERAHRTIAGSDDCIVHDAADTHRQYFLRALLPIPVRGKREACCWGLWVEVDEATMSRVVELWNDPRQSTEPPFPARVANAIKRYPPTLGLPGTLQLTGPTTPPRFVLDPGLDHLLAEEQRRGVFPERVLEWLHSH